MKSNKAKIYSIEEVLDSRTGKYEKASLLFSKDEASCWRLRTKVLNAAQGDTPLYLCGTCAQPLKIYTRKINKFSHSFHFRHYYKSGDCPIKTDQNYTRQEIQCMKYNGAKESAAHMRIKMFVAEYLLKDSRFTNVAIEKVLKGTGSSKTYKKPDISARFNGRPVVFEIQLSTTFLDVIISRENFYQSEGVAIFWIFSDLDPKTARATDKDVYFNNKSNALSVNKYSRQLTLAEGELVFNGHYKNVLFDDKTGSIQEFWEVTPVRFKDIEFDGFSHKPFFISYDEKLKLAKRAQITHRQRKPLRQLVHLVLDEGDNYKSCDYKSCAENLASIGLYRHENLATSTCNLIKALLSVKDGRIYFKNQDNNWAWLVNYIWQHHINYWVVLLYMVKLNARTDIAFPKSNYKIQEKRKAFKKGYRPTPPESIAFDQTYNSNFDQDNELYPLFVALFPELSGSLKS